MRNKFHERILIPLFEVINDKMVAKKDRKIFFSNGMFFFEPKEDYGGPQRVSEIFNTILCGRINGYSSCIFCKIEFNKENNVLIVGGKTERSPTTISNQLKLIDKGLYLIIEPRPWHLFNEIIVPISHYESTFDLSESILKNMVETAIWRWGIYETVEKKIGTSLDLGHKKSIRKIQ